MKHSNLIQESDKMSIVRIAPVYGGKVYVTPHPSDKEESPRMDLPIVESVAHVSAKSGKTARHIVGKYHQHLDTEVSPRFCVMHRSASCHEKTIYLYVLPLKTKDEIHFHGGEWVTSDDIVHRPETFSPDLQTEGELIGMAAELWEEFHAPNA